MLVSVAGSQGSGKSTLIKLLHEQGYPIISRKTSRSILTDWGVTIQEVNSTPDLTKKFQDEIILRKFMDEKEAISAAEIVFTERTYADLFTYALLALGSNNEFDPWLNDYYFRCMEYQQTYDQVFYLTAGHFKVEPDGVRFVNKHYSMLTDTYMKDCTQRMTPAPRFNVIATPSLQERLAMVNIQSNAMLNRDAFIVNILQNT